MFQMMSPGVDYNLTMSRTETKMTVLVMPKVNGLEDKARHNLVPFTLCATADEIDRGFFPALQQPLPVAATLLTNMADFEKRANKAAANSKAAKDEKAKTDKDEKQKKEKYDTHLKKAEELEAAENYDGAVMQLQQARLHATEKDAKTVDEKIAALKAKASQGLLFNVPTVEPAPEVPQPVIANAQPEQTAPQPAVAQPAPEQPQPQPAQPQPVQQPQQAPPPAFPPMLLRPDRIDHTVYCNQTHICRLRSRHPPPTNHTEGRSCIYPEIFRCCN